MCKRFKERFLRSDGFVGRLFEQYGFRTVVFAAVSFAVSLAYAVYNGVFGIVYASTWYGALGAYYLLLAVTRGGILLYHRKKMKCSGKEDVSDLKIRELKTYISSGIMLVLLPIALSVAILEMVVSDKSFVRAGLLIYFSAAYTFYKIITSIINFVKARKLDDFTVRAIRNINLADALVSVLALQTAMFHEFSPNMSFGTENAITGGFVCALTVASGIAMIAVGCKNIRRIKAKAIESNIDF